MGVYDLRTGSQAPDGLFRGQLFTISAGEYRGATT